MIHAHLIPAEVVPAVPALGGVAFGVATLATLLAFIACWGLRHAWAATIGYGLRWVASEVRDVGVPTGFFGSIHPFGRLADVFEAVDHFVAHALAVAALNTQHAFVYCAHTTAHIFVWTGQEIARLSRDTLQFAEGLYTHTLPRWRRQILHEAAHASNVAIGGLRRAERAVEGRLHREIAAAEARALHAVHAVAGTLDHVIPRVHGLEHDFKGLLARLERLERLLRPAAIVALIGATIFKDFGLGWLRCSNVGKVGRALCGFPAGAIEALLALGTEIIIVGDLCTIANAIEGAAVLIEPELQKLVNLENFLCRAGGASFPTAILAADTAGGGGNPSAIAPVDLAA